MRARLPILALFAGFSLVTLDSVAGPNGPPPLQAGPTTRIQAFRLAPVGSIPGKVVAVAASSYTGGAVAVDIDVSNSAAADSNATVKLETAHTNVLVGQGTLAVPKNGTATLKLTDSVGLTSACAPKRYNLTVTSAAGTDTRPVEITPTCKTASAIVDEWNQIEPDRVDAQKQASAYLSEAKLESATCSGGLKISAYVTNHTKTAVPSMVAQGKDPAGVVHAAVAAAFPLGAGESKTVKFTPYGAPDLPDIVDLVLVDWAHVLGTGLSSSVNNHRIRVTTTKTCTLAASFVSMTIAPAAPLPVPK